MKKVLFCLCIMFLSHLNGDTLTISGNPGPLVINTAIAGSAPGSVSDNSTSYRVSTTSKRTLTGKINSAMPNGVTLQVSCAVPSGGTSSGLQTMGTTAKTLGTNINSLVPLTNYTITYRLNANVRAAPVSNQTRTFTLTVQ